MASRHFVGNTKTLVREVVKLYAKFTTVDGAACTLAASPDNLGIASVVESGTGVYTVTLQDSYVGLLSVSAIADDAAGSDKVYFEVDGSATDVTTATGGVIVLTAMANNVAKNMTEGNTVYLEITLRNCAD